MDEVELINIATNYLKELGYTINDNNILVNDKTVSFSKVKKEELYNESKNMILINNIDVFVDEYLILIMEQSSSFSYHNMKDFYNDKFAKLSERIVSKKYSFTKIDDRVIKSCNKKITELYNGNVISKINNNYMDIIEVDNNYLLTDGYPYKSINKKLIKE